jgi:hypothetical protein
MNCPLRLERFWNGDLHALSGPLVTAGSALHHDKEHVRASWCRQDSLRYAVHSTRGAFPTEHRHVASSSSHVCSGWTLRLLRQILSGLRDYAFTKDPYQVAGLNCSGCVTRTVVSSADVCSVRHSCEQDSQVMSTTMVFYVRARWSHVERALGPPRTQDTAARLAWSRSMVQSRRLKL